MYILPETTTRAAQVKATGLIAYKALVDHAIDNGLQCPLSIDLHDEYVKVWLSNEASSRWVESIHVDDEQTRDGVVEDREIVAVTGRLPLLGIKVQLRFSRVAVPSGLRAVTA